MVLRATLLRITRVEPLDCTIWRFFKSANNRVTVSREVPIIWAISSWVSARFLFGGLAVFRTPFQEEFGQLFRCRMREPQGTHFVAGAVVFLAELLRHLEAGLGVVFQETEKIFALHEIDLAGIDGFRRQLVGLARNRRA